MSNKLVDNIGYKLEEEMILDLCESMNEDKLIKFSKVLGFDIFGDTIKGHFMIGEFDLNLQKSTTIKREHQPIDKTKTWWKFW